MIHRLSDRSELTEARRLCRALADGQADLSARWLDATGARVLAQESGRHLEVDEATAVSEAYEGADISSLVAIVTDSLVTDDEAYLLNANAADLSQLSHELAGLNFLLTDSGGTRCILFTADDFKLVAGPLAFVTQIAGDPSAASEEFKDFVSDAHEALRPALERAEAYMRWVEAAGKGHDSDGRLDL